MKCDRFVSRYLFIFVIGIFVCHSPIKNAYGYQKTIAKRTLSLIDEILEGAKVSKKHIKHLSKMKKLGEITQGIAKYPPETRKAILLSIAKERGIIRAIEADELYGNVGKIDGFENVTKLLCSASKANVKGALYELKTANSAYKNGFKVVRIRGEFYGGSNKLLSDIDVLLETMSGKRIAIECKNYSGKVPYDTIAYKVEKMEIFVKENPGTKLAFSFANEPGPLVRKMLEKKGIIVLVGDPDAQMKALRLIV